MYLEVPLSRVSKFLMRGHDEILNKRKNVKTQKKLVLNDFSRKQGTQVLRFGTKKGKKRLILYEFPY